MKARQPGHNDRLTRRVIHRRRGATHWLARSILGQCAAANDHERNHLPVQLKAHKRVVLKAALSSRRGVCCRAYRVGFLGDD